MRGHMWLNKVASVLGPKEFQALTDYFLMWERMVSDNLDLYKDSINCSIFVVQ